MKYNLKWMAEAGYLMGLKTIGEVANHVEAHYDAYFSVEHMDAESYDFELVYSGHEDESIDLYLSALDKQRLDEELDEALRDSPDSPDIPPGTPA